MYEISTSVNVYVILFNKTIYEIPNNLIIGSELFEKV